MEPSTQQASSRGQPCLVGVMGQEAWILMNGSWLCDLQGAKSFLQASVFPNLQIAKEQTQAVGPVVWMNPSPHSGCLRGDGWEQTGRRCGASESTGDTEDSSLSLEPNLNSNHLFFLAMKPSQKWRCRPNRSPNTKFSRCWESQFWCKGNHGLREDTGQEDGELKLGHAVILSISVLPP